MINNVKDKVNQLQVAAGYQLGKNKNSETNSTYLGSFNGRIAYSMVLKPKVITIMPSVRINTYKRTTGNQMRFTPAATVKTNFLDSKMKLNYTFSTIIGTFQNFGIANTAIRNDVNWSYRYIKKQSLSLRLIHQQNLIKSSVNYGDFQGDLRWTISL